MANLKVSRILLLLVWCWSFGIAAQVPIANANVAEQYLQAAADSERAVLDLSPLRRDPALVAAARAHALQMVAHGAISHKFADEPELAGRGAAAGARFSLISENVAESSSAVKIHVAWMQSEGHRHNLLDPRVDTVGIAVIARGHQLFAVEDFARSLPSITLNQQERAVAAVIASMNVPIAQDDLDARKICADDEASTSGPPPAFVMRYTTADLGRLPDQLKTLLKTGTYATAAVAACTAQDSVDFSMYRIAVLLYRR